MKVSSPMAATTVPESACDYTNDDASAAITNVAQAVAILQAVKIAADAVEDGSAQYENPHVARWSPAIGVATRKVGLVRDTMIDTAGAPSVDWFTSLALLEALDAALWHTSSRYDTSQRMDVDSVKDLCDVIIIELAKLKQGLAECR
jgi:hypothetical protein